MLIKNKDEFELYPYRVRYYQNGEEIEQWALPSKQWWTDFANKWGHTEIIEFIEVTLTQEQLARYREIKKLNTPEGFRESFIDYILNGAFPEGVNHPLRNLQMQKITDVSANYLVDLDFRLSSIELGI